MALFVIVKRRPQRLQPIEFGAALARALEALYLADRVPILLRGVDA